MPMLRRVVLGLNTATVVLVVAGIALLVIPAPMPGDQPAAMVASTGSLPDTVRHAAPDPGATDRVVRMNIFSARRSPPSRRSMFGEVPDEVGVDASEVVASDMVPATLAAEPLDSTTASTASDAVPHLYGTMMGPTDMTALLRLDAHVTEPRLYRVGDHAGGYRVVEIADRSVTVVGPGGRVVLRLARPNP